MYGVSFKKAVDIALSKRLAKSRFWIPPERQTESVFYAQLLVKVARQKASNGGNLNVEAWQWIGDGIEVDYVHMILNPNTMIVNHLDGALIHYNSELEIATMFNTADKQKGCMYEKYFRLDGHIPMDSAIEMVRAFFPIQELVDEYFQHDPCWPAALG
ncbi:MAG: hypothetical protein IPK83_24460 [Planctomycetes bacterium]|nr:hypothetical protein [Planctomycetota bacterium]